MAGDKDNNGPHNNGQDNNSWLGSLPARFHFAQYDPEQRFEREHTTARAAAANALYIPLMHIEKQVLYPGQTGNNLSAIAMRIASNVGAKNWSARYLRSLTSGYDNWQAFQQTGRSCEHLQALAGAASGFSSQGASYAAEVERTTLSPIHSLIAHSDEAGKMFSGLIRGQLAITPESTAKLETHLNAMADLCHERAVMLRHINYHSGDGDVISGHRPSDFIREVIEAKEITSPRQLEILFSFLPALIADGAVQLSTEIFIPKDQTFLTPKQSVMLSEYVERVTREYGLENKDGVMTRRDPVSGQPRPLQLKEITEIGNTLLQRLQAVAGRESDTLLAFADSHYEEVEKRLLQAAHPQTPKAPELPSYDGRMMAATPWKDRVRGGEYTQGDMSPTAIAKHVFRPESRHEIGKLFSRYLPMYALAFPVGIISNILLGFTKKDAVTGKTQWLTKANVISSLFNLATYPIVESAGVVTLKEAFSFPQSLMLERAGKMESVLDSMVHASCRLSPDLAASVEASEHSNQLLDALKQHPLFRKVQEITAKSDSAKTVQDYETLDTYFREMGKVVHAFAGKVMAPYRKREDETLGDITQRVVTHGAENIAEAALALSFARAAIHISKTHVNMLEFEDPSGILMNRNQIKQLTDYIDRQSHAAGIRSGEGGQLLKRNEETGREEPASQEDIIRFANVVTNKLAELVPVKKLVSAANGQLKEEYQVALAEDLFGGRKKPALSLASQKPAVHDAPADTALTRPWTDATGTGAGDVVRGILDAPRHIKAAYDYAMRPEAHNESKLLLGRMFFTRLLAFPSEIIENIVLGHTKVNPETQQKQWVTAENLKSAVWKLLSFPVVYSYGVVVSREMFMYPQKLTIDSSNDAGNLLLAAIHSGTSLAPELKNNLGTLSRSNPELAAIEARPEFQQVARIASKPPEQRSARDDQFMRQFFEQTGDAVLSHAARLLAGNNDASQADASMQEHVQRVVSSPVGSVDDAVLALAFTQSLLHFNTQHIGVLRYLDPQEVIINRSGVSELSSYIRTQATAAGFTVEEGQLCHQDSVTRQAKPVSDHELIRFANVVTQQLRKVVNADRLAEVTQGMMADQYLGYAQKHIFQSPDSGQRER